MFTTSDVRIPYKGIDDNGHECHEVVLWHVLGIDAYYPTKIAAESAARAVFFDETEKQRYSRITFGVFWRM